ncbi:MAG: UDP-N-acetylmuramoyl-L-alanine--D-glutamate ligase, partial [Gammaproteobacteria bacterium]|nr:UDP-N-acetylmuramoyl-L-alanine--D-glutamate ligase [Gammaproteobacteria bacterium]
MASNVSPILARYDESAVTTSRQDSATLVVGLGATGVATARYLATRGVDVTVIDSRPAPPGLAELRQTHPEIRVILASQDPRWLEGVDQVVLSPGLGLDTPIAVQARQAGIPLLGDIELFARAAEAPVLAVTGSNGKSTVVTLLQRMLSATGLDVAAGGNLGPPALQLLEESADIYLLEISSFQLETTESLKPQVAAVLNVSPDHLDRHGSLAEYAACKSKLLRAANTAVFNWDDALVRKMTRDHPRAVPFSLRENPHNGYGIMEHNGERWLAGHGKPLLPVAAMRLRGAHNEANALAALALSGALERDLSPQLAVLEQFAGLPHRCQWIGEQDGVTFINDSKATNVAASVAALEDLDGPFVLIAGGQSKGADFSALTAAARGKLVAAVLIGEAAEQLEAALSSSCPIQVAADLEAAVSLARAFATTGTTILLSPA